MTVVITQTVCESRRTALSDLLYLSASQPPFPPVFPNAPRYPSEWSAACCSALELQTVPQARKTDARNAIPLCPAAAVELVPAVGHAASDVAATTEPHPNLRNCGYARSGRAIPRESARRATSERTER